MGGGDAIASKLAKAKGSTFLLHIGSKMDFSQSGDNPKGPLFTIIEKICLDTTYKTQRRISRT